MLRSLRIFLLLLVMAGVALAQWRGESRLSAWQNSIYVGIYPVAGDASPATADYVRRLSRDNFSEIEGWLQEESRRYGRDVLQPVVLSLAPPLQEQPPERPGSASPLDNLVWSLRLRWWASRHDAIAGTPPAIRLFVVFHDPEQTPRVPHSTGLNKGRMGVVHAFAHRRQQLENNVVIAHELLHVFGASDKYDPVSLQPVFPLGYAEPARNPRYPQQWAEIMGGRIPLSPTQLDMPAGLAETLIGAETAREIGLLR